jgi:hypothetical protein
MRDHRDFERRARENLGSAYDAYVEARMIGPARADYKPPELEPQKTTEGWRITIVMWFREPAGWDLLRHPLNDVYYGSWGEAQAAMLELYPRVPA